MEAVRITLEKLIQGIEDRDRLVERAFCSSGDNANLRAIQEKMNQKRGRTKATILSLYKDKADGFIGAEEYKFLSAQLFEEQKKLEESYETLSGEVHLRKDLPRFKKLAQEKLDCRKLEREITLKLIDQISVSSDKTLTIHFPFVNPLYEHRKG